MRDNRSLEEWDAFTEALHRHYRDPRNEGNLPRPGQYQDIEPLIGHPRGTPHMRVDLGTELRDAYLRKSIPGDTPALTVSAMLDYGVIDFNGRVRPPTGTGLYDYGPPLYPHERDQAARRIIRRALVPPSYDSTDNPPAYRYNTGGLGTSTPGHLAPQGSYHNQPAVSGAAALPSSTSTRRSPRQDMGSSSRHSGNRPPPAPNNGYGGPPPGYTP